MSFFAQILAQAEKWQVHIPRDNAYADVVLRPFCAEAVLPEAEGLMHADWCEIARAYNCRVDVEYLINNVKKLLYNADFKHEICEHEAQFLAMRLLSMAEQSHLMPDAGRVTLRMFHVLWALRSPAMGNASSHIHAFLSDLRSFTEENLRFRAHYSALPPKKRPIQEGESCAIVAENGLLMLRFLGASLTIPARFLEA